MNHKEQYNPERGEEKVCVLTEMERREGPEVDVVDGEGGGREVISL